MTKLKIRVSKSLKNEVLEKAAEMVKNGKEEAELGNESLGPLKVYIDKEPAKTLHVFDGDESGELKGKKIYVGTDA